MRSKTIKKRPVSARLSRARPKHFTHHLGTPLKSLTKTQVALFGVVFISTILLSPILMFVRTKESLYSLKVNIYSLKVNDVVI